MRAAACAAALSLAAPAAASDFVLAQPIDCILGETCHIQSYVDRDAGPGAQDYRCGTLSYDGHKGTDFALPTLAEMRAGVDVLAAAPGVVAGSRDGMPDSGYSEASAAQIDGRECGNGVVLRHDGGYETQYCHLKRGSLRVRDGERVAAGTVLGQVGLSGLTEFPHLHLSLRRDGEEIDPFDSAGTETCAPGDAHLWQSAPPYQPGGMLMVGFAPGIPGYDAVQAGSAARAELARDAPGLVLFGYAYGGQKGDTMRLVISGPQGAVIDEVMPIDADQARFFRAAGKRRPAGGWPAGRYVGEVELRRNGQVLGRLTREISLR